MAMRMKEYSKPIAELVKELRNSKTKFDDSLNDSLRRMLTDREVTCVKIGRLL